MRISSFKSLYDGYIRARRGKRDNPEVARFGANLEENLINLQNHLIWGTWEPGPYESFEVTEPKRRMVNAPAFRDRVLHQSIYAHLSPICERVFIDHSYACRPAKGTHAGANRAQALLRKVRRSQGTVYALKADISSYFDSIDHEVLKRLLRFRIQCPYTLWLCDTIIDTSPAACGIGLPLGNLTSQLFANLYLHELDHYVTRVLGMGNYVRYMDDWLIVDGSSDRLHEVLRLARDFLWRSLRLNLNRKTQVFPVGRTSGRALDFLGYKIWENHRALRRRGVRKGFQRARAFAKDPNPHNLDRLTSWYAHACHAEPVGMMRRIFETIQGEGGNVQPANT